MNLPRSWTSIHLIERPATSCPIHFDAASRLRIVGRHRILGPLARDLSAYVTCHPVRPQPHHATPTWAARASVVTLRYDEGMISPKLGDLPRVGVQVPL